MPWVRLLRDREELQTVPSGLPVFRLIMEDQGCGHGLLRVYRPFIRKGRRSFPGALERRAPAAAWCFLIPNLHLS